MKANRTEQPKTFGEWRAARFAREERRAARIAREIAQERDLFRNDLAEYRYSNEGKAFAAALDGGRLDEIRKAAAVYYGARNGAGVHYDDESERERARQQDRALADLFAEID